jgi:hypothetical protein
METELEDSAKISRYIGKQNPGRNSGGTGFQPVQKTLIYQRVIHRLVSFPMKLICHRLNHLGRGLNLV